MITPAGEARPVLSRLDAALVGFGLGIAVALWVLDRVIDQTVRFVAAQGQAEIEEWLRDDG